MGVYIKDMEMPKSCFECPFMLHRCFCLVNPKIEFTDKEYSELKGRYVGCPLVEVPPLHYLDVEAAPTIIETEE